MEQNPKEDKFYFDGTGDVTKFVEKAELVAVLKNHENEKKAIFIASKLTGIAFDVYRRLSSDDKKDPEKIKEELRKEYCREQRNREEALHGLMNSKILSGESAQSFSYIILYLVGLAYSGFNDATQKTIAKDYFVNGLSNDLQVALKCVATYSTMDLKIMSDETTRLEIAGVSVVKKEIKVVETETEIDFTDKVAEKVLEKLKSSTLRDTVPEEINFIHPSYRSHVNYRSGSHGYYNRSGSPRGRSNCRGSQPNQDVRRCRACQSQSHLFRNCPVRHCQACGGKGHDAWSPTCPNYS